MRFWCDFAYKTRLTLPCTNAFFAKHRADWKESYHIIWRHLSNFCQLGGILSQRYATKNPCVVGWDRFCTQIAWKIACVNGPLELKSAGDHDYDASETIKLIDKDKRSASICETDMISGSSCYLVPLEKRRLISRLFSEQGHHFEKLAQSLFCGKTPRSPACVASFCPMEGLNERETAT